MRINILIFIYFIHFAYLRCTQNLKTLALIEIEKSVKEISIGEKEKFVTEISIGVKEKWTNKGTDKQYVAVFFVAQNNSSLSSFVPNFRILSQVVHEKSLAEKKFTDKQTNIITEKAKTIYPLYTSTGGINMDVDEDSDQKLDLDPCWIRQLGHSKQAFAHTWW